MVHEHIAAFHVFCFCFPAMLLFSDSQLVTQTEDPTTAHLINSRLSCRNHQPLDNNRQSAIDNDLQRHKAHLDVGTTLPVGVSQQLLANITTYPFNYEAFFTGG
jgi:hypothetical protein